MSKQEELREASKKALSKQGTEQLKTKLEKGTLFGISLEVALEILQKRGVDVSSYKKEEIEKKVEEIEVELIEKNKEKEKRSGETYIKPGSAADSKKKNEKLGKTERVKVEKPKREKKLNETGEKKKPNSTLIREMITAGSNDEEIIKTLEVTQQYINSVRAFDASKLKK